MKGKVAGMGSRQKFLWQFSGHCYMFFGRAFSPVSLTEFYSF